MKYLLATNNPDKVTEIESIFATHGLEITSLAKLGLFFEAQEPWDTFEQNAMEKATQTQKYLQSNGYRDIAVIADDSGLMIDVLGGIPGVDSANYMGRETPYDVRNQNLIGQVDKFNNRVARFVCVIACVYPCGKQLATTGEIVGEIARTPQGDNGFGYDPIFYIPMLGKTTAQLSAGEKNRISHRGKALAKMIGLLTGDTDAGN